jgi:large subunit ribosomal protein L10
MSKPVKQMIVADYRKRFGDMDGALLIGIRGVNANENNTLRLGLARRNIRVTVLKNTLARKAFAGTKLAAFEPVLDGPCAIAYGGESTVELARVLVEWDRKVEQLSLKGAILDGRLFGGEAGVKRLSEFPTRAEARGAAVALVLAPGAQLVSLVTAPGGEILSIVQAIIDKLEQGGEVRATA